MVTSRLSWFKHIAHIVRAAVFRIFDSFVHIVVIYCLLVQQDVGLVLLAIGRHTTSVSWLCIAAMLTLLLLFLYIKLLLWVVGKVERVIRLSSCIRLLTFTLLALSTLSHHFLTLSYQLRWLLTNSIRALSAISRVEVWIIEGLIGSCCDLKYLIFENDPMWSLFDHASRWCNACEGILGR